MGVPYEDKSSFDLPPLVGGAAKSKDYEAVKVSSMRVALDLDRASHNLLFSELFLNKLFVCQLLPTLELSTPLS